MSIRRVTPPAARACRLGPTLAVALAACGGADLPTDPAAARRVAARPVVAPTLDPCWAGTTVPRCAPARHIRWSYFDDLQQSARVFDLSKPAATLDRARGLTVVVDGHEFTDLTKMSLLFIARVRGTCVASSDNGAVTYTAPVSIFVIPTAQLASTTGPAGHLNNGNVLYQQFAPGALAAVPCGMYALGKYRSGKLTPAEIEFALHYETQGTPAPGGMASYFPGAGYYYPASRDETLRFTF